MILQKERFGEEELQLTIEVEDAVRAIIVPKMILQPIVENIFKHGFEDGIRQGLVSISCRLDKDDQLIISVQDNGKGISKEQLSTLEAGLLNIQGSAHEEIGLRNVLARLRLQISEDAQLKIEQNRETGLTVTLIIPLNEKRGLMRGEES